MDLRHALAILAIVLGGGFAVVQAADCGCDGPVCRLPNLHQASGCPCPLCCCPSCYPGKQHERRHCWHICPAPPAAPAMQTVMSQAAAVVAQTAIPVQPAMLTPASLAALQQVHAAQQKKDEQTRAASADDEIAELLRLLNGAMAGKLKPPQQPAVPAVAESAEKMQRLEELVESLNDMVRQRTGVHEDKPLDPEARIDQLTEEVQRLQETVELLLRQREQEVPRDDN